MENQRLSPAHQSRHVAICLPNFGGGGAERVALASAKDLADRGHKVDLVLAQATGALLPLIPKSVRVVDLRAHRLRATLPALVRYLRTERPDAFHAMMWPLTVIAIVAHKLARSDSLLLVSDQNALSRHVPGGLARSLLVWTTRTLYPLADHRIVVSEAAAVDLAELSGIARDSIEVIYNPIEPPQRIATNPTVEELWKGAGPRIITVGSMKEQKNHLLLLEAFAKLPMHDAQLMILGQGHLRTKLELRARELGVAGRVILPGFAIDPWPYLASAHLFVLSSDYEGFPLVLAEAMHAGLRVVSTDCLSGPAEMLDDGRYGRLVPCGDAAALAKAIEATLADPARPEQMRDRAIAMAGPAMIERYTKLLTA